MANTYTTYKDSGIPWIGEIPSEWTINLVSTLFHEHKEKNTGLKCTNLLSLSYGNIKKKNINTNEGLLPQSFETYNIIDKNDIVFRLTDLQNDKRSLRTGLCRELGIITSAYVTLRANMDLDSRYYHYLFHSYDICKVYYGLGDGVRQGMNYEDLKLLKIIHPTLIEQESIANFLDKKCSEIDELISLQEKMIDELKAYKQSVITEAVTKGLDRNVKMKDSGVDWIGEIPEHWDIPKLAYVTSKIGSGSTPRGGSEIYVSEGIKFLRSQNILNERLNLDDVAYITEEIDAEMQNTRVQIDDILFNITGGSIGRCFYVDENLGRANVNQHVCIVRPKGIYTKFLLYYLQSENGQHQVRILQTGGNREGLSAAAFKDFVVVLPTPKEQQDIAGFLDNKCSEIDSLISIKEKKIEELKDYKKSLIYEYVTGKKRV